MSIRATLSFVVVLVLLAILFLYGILVQFPHINPFPAYFPDNYYRQPIYNILIALFATASLFCIYSYLPPVKHKTRLKEFVLRVFLYFSLAILIGLVFGFIITSNLQRFSARCVIREYSPVSEITLENEYALNLLISTGDTSPSDWLSYEKPVNINSSVEYVANQKILQRNSLSIEVERYSPARGILIRAKNAEKNLARWVALNNPEGAIFDLGKQSVYITFFSVKIPLDKEISIEKDKHSGYLIKVRDRKTGEGVIKKVYKGISISLEEFVQLSIEDVNEQTGQVVAKISYQPGAVLWILLAITVSGIIIVTRIFYLLSSMPDLC